MIRDSKTKEILFFGVTYEPNEWQGSTCEGLEDQFFFYNKYKEKLFYFAKRIML